MAGPIVLNGRDGAKPSISPAELGEVLEFVADGEGGLSPKLDHKAAVRSFSPALASTVREPVEATFTLSGGRPEVVASRTVPASTGPRHSPRSRDGAHLDQSSQRTVDVVYDVVKPNCRHRKQRVSASTRWSAEFTTGGFAEASGENIRLVAQTVDGAVVLPGESFSLNRYTGTRGSAQGYVTSTIIDHGHVEGGGRWHLPVRDDAVQRGVLRRSGGCGSHRALVLHLAVSGGPGGDGVRRRDRSGVPQQLRSRHRHRHRVVAERDHRPPVVTKTVEVQSITGSRSLYTDPEKVTPCPPGTTACRAMVRRVHHLRHPRDHRREDRCRDQQAHRTVKYDPEPNVVCQ